MAQNKFKSLFYGNYIDSSVKCYCIIRQLFGELVTFKYQVVTNRYPVYNRYIGKDEEYLELRVKGILG